MSPFNEAYLRHQQSRWMRPDAARFIRPDAARFLKPGIKLEDVFPALALKYSPSQPRVPSGSGRESGRWTDGNGGSSGTLSQPMGNVTIDSRNGNEQDALFRIEEPESNSDELELASEESISFPDPLLSRHIIDNHVGKTDEELIARIEKSQIRGLFVSSGFDRNGSFESQEAAQDFIRQTLELNAGTVSGVASGKIPDAFLTERFGSGTGREAILEDGIIRVRRAYMVGVAITHEKSSKTGYRIRSAYPRNFNPRLGR